MKKTSSTHHTDGTVRKIVREELNRAKSTWIGEIADRVTGEVNDNFTTKIAKFKDEIITLLDKVMGELKTIREEFAVMAPKLSDHTDTLENHETRISKLQQPLPTT